ncbi:site-specific DNA-methyltransferase [Eleftheria terrae]|uniref:site-specific DNA-methyltransferase n=1 Tax=Eleftheria terrae TaxID=1597781 RepID=UPI00263AEE90|nr:site-specific DNA-methyltransferase [Eleftheria terrae]WKB56000.1 site-specific DNA-methyltransferase [Eleftheria terrae]
MLNNTPQVTNWLATRIEHWPIERLLPYAKNARTHSDTQIAQIAASIVEFGFVNACLVGADGVLVAGHGRVLAARLLKLVTVPVVVLDHLTPLQRRALVIADNRTAELAGWDDELLRLELKALDVEGFDLDLTGFDADALTELLQGEEPDDAGATDDDAVPEPEARPISRPGDVWLMGKHRLVCGDATTAEAYQLLLGDGQVDMVFADPPYNVAYTESAMHRKRGAARPILNDALGEGFQQFLTDALALMVPRCRGAMYIAMSSSELDALQAAFREAGGHWSTFIIWAKNRFSLGTADYQRQFEPILYGWPKGAKRHWYGDRDQSDIWQIERRAKNDLHPTMKPVELVERAIRNSSRPGDVVLDPFAGSGTTLIAAEKTGRVARMMELDAKYADVVIRRWQQWTEQSAVRESDQQPFDALAAVSV